MPPNQQGNIGVLYETDDFVDTKNVNYDQKPRDYKIVWRNVIFYGYIHLAAVYATYLMFTSAKLLTTVNTIALLQLGNFGITCGVHRLFSHRSYKAKTPLKIILVILQTLSFQNSVMVWSRDHRVHHKFSETDADPHNPKRGFFYAHAGWLLTRKHPDVHEKGKCVDISDLSGDPILKFQHKYYVPLGLFTAIFLPTAVPMYLWGETFTSAWNLNLWRCCIGINMAWCVNSLAHGFGNRPYDKYINPTENIPVIAMTLGEGYHNYHHVFPWDYKASEFGKYTINFNTAVIDFFARIGWAYDLKTTSEDLIKKRTLRTGDGSHHVWGWNDKDMLKEDLEDAVILNKHD